MAIFTGLTDYLGRVIRPILGKYATGDYREVMVDENGYLMVVRANEEMEGGTPAGVNVGTDSTEILNEDTSRRGAIIVNDSDTTIYLAIGKTAVAHKGIRLNAEGGVLVIAQGTDIFSLEAINGIHAGTGNKVVTVQEFERCYIIQQI